jgi:hypothetical protein
VALRRTTVPIAAATVPTTAQSHNDKPDSHSRASLASRLGRPSFLSLALNVRDKVDEADANRLADAQVRQLAAFADPVHDGGAHAKELGDLADRKQGCTRNRTGEII